MASSKGKRLSILLLALSLSAALTPVFIQNTHAFGCTPTCSLDAITNVPPPDKVVRIQLDGVPTSIYNLNHTFTFGNNSIHSLLVLDTYFIGASTGKRYTFSGWYTYGPNGWFQFDYNPMDTPPMYTDYTVAQCNPGPPGQNCPFWAVFTVSPPLGCKTNCYLDALSNVPASEGTIKVQVDGGTSYPLSPTIPMTPLCPSSCFPFGNGTVHSIKVLNQTFIGASSGARYAWKQWSCACSGYAPTANATLTTPIMYSNYTDPARSPPLNGIGGFTAIFYKQFQLTMNFVDTSNQPISPPTSLTLTNGMTTLNLNSYSANWINAGVWTVSDATWEGAPGMVSGSQTIDLSNGALVSTVTLKVYSASVKTVDGSGNPVAGVTVQATFLNSTTVTLASNSNGLVDLGHIPLGPYSVQVTYQGQTSNYSPDASTQQQPSVVTLATPGSGTKNSTAISAIVLLTIFGLALFLVLMAIKVRKPPPPPQI